MSGNARRSFSTNTSPAHSIRSPQVSSPYRIKVGTCPFPSLHLPPSLLLVATGEAMAASALASSATVSSLFTNSRRTTLGAPPPRNVSGIRSVPFNPLRVLARPRGTTSSPPRKLYQIRAATLQEKDEKVAIEESFPVKTLPKYDEEETDFDPATMPFNQADNWAVKVEQSLNIFITDSTITVLDMLYHDRHYARFFVLETIARVPYFAFISVLHLYESLGWWRRADYIKVHFAETWNEMHHLLIMEELGGNSFWLDRFLAQVTAVLYYFMTVAMYMLSPRMAYHFQECVERHAFSTYDKFLKLQGEELKKLPAPEAAVKYYMSEDLYLFDEFQSERTPNTRRPIIENLYDVFMNIRDDEAEHCKTMRSCQTPGSLRSPHSCVESSDDDAAGCDAADDNYEGNRIKL